MPHASRVKLIAAFAAIYVIWGSTYLASLMAIQTLPPLLMAGSRFLVAGLILLAWAFRGAPAMPTKRQLRNAAIIGLLLLVGGNGAVVLAEREVSSGLAALIVATLPIWMVLLEWARPGGTTPTPGVVVGLILGLVGLAVLIGPAVLHPDAVGTANNGIRIVGVVILMIGEISWATGSILARHMDLPRSAPLATAIEMLAAGVVFIVVSTLTHEPEFFDIARVSGRSIAGLIYLITFGSLVAFSAYVWLLKVSTPAKVATYAYVNPVVALFLGWALAGERLSLRTAIASAIIIAAVAAITTARGSRAT
jgi:drug/metabolite transporter (DMT)-like permease